MLTRCTGVSCREYVTDPGVCDICWRYRFVLLTDLPALWKQAHGLLPRTATRTEMVSGGAGPTSQPPIRMSVYHAMESTLGVVERWANRIRERLGWKPFPTRAMVRSAWLFQVCVTTLRDQDWTLVAEPTATQYYRDLYVMRRRLVAVTMTRRQDMERLNIVCPECDRMTITTRNYGDDVACLTCAAQWGQAAFHSRITGELAPLSDHPTG